MVEETLNLGDIPDFSGITDDSATFEPFGDGWYAGTILDKRVFTDKNGNDRIFESGDNPAQSSNSRNIKLQVVVKRQSDGRTMNLSALTNYRPEDLTQETVQAVIAHKEKVKEGEEWGPLFRSFMTLQRLGTLQRIAGVRQFQRNGNGGLDLTPLYNKTGYFKITPDDRNPQYKMISNYLEVAPKRGLL